MIVKERKLDLTKITNLLIHIKVNPILVLHDAIQWNFWKL